jgi:beta-amylase
VRELTLLLQAVMSFHQCGGNVGDKCNIPLPAFVLRAAAASGRNVFYTAFDGWQDTEYLSGAADHAALFPPNNRTPLDMYHDFMASFGAEFASELASGLIDEAQIGLGPSGELRYPAYPLAHYWNYCGVGYFMAYDDYMKASLASAGKAKGWTAPPSDTGGVNAHPSGGAFFSSGYTSAYGDFFLNWYSSVLLQHASDVLSVAAATLGKQTNVAAKVSGVHWWYADQSHAAEATAGYYNTNGRNAYASIGVVFKQLNVTFDFTCLELANPSAGSTGCASRPASLVAQTRAAAVGLGIRYSGENALDICYPGGCDAGKFNQVIQQARSATYGTAIARFTFLRLSDDLFSSSNAFNSFASFVRNMKNTN